MTLPFVAVDEVFDVTSCVVDAVHGTIGVPEMVGSPIRLTDDGIPVKYKYKHEQSTGVHYPFINDCCHDRHECERKPFTGCNALSLTYSASYITR